MIKVMENTCDVAAWRCTPPLDAATHRALWRDMALDAFKWDGQVGDVTTLAPFAIVLPAAAWRELACVAEALAAELVAVEGELAQRPELWRQLGLPRRVLAALGGNDPWTPTAARVIRFDFHPTADGWRVSEANSDVPGGYTEASVFTRRMAENAAGAIPAGDPSEALCAALAARAREHGRVALLAAPGYVEDLQVVSHLRAALRRRGIEAACLRPEQLQWRARIAHLTGARGLEPIDLVFRFYQGEWMTRVRGDDWRNLFRGGRTPVCNPPTAVLSESKRVPALQHELTTPMPTWRRFVPITRPIRAAWMTPGEEWVLKRSYSNTGDSVLARDWSPRTEFVSTLLHGLVAPAEWIAQKRFETQRLPTPLGFMYPCIGVYVVNGCACGIYGRLSSHPVVNFTAIDAAVLVEANEPANG
jgi:glutathionylspermidine synthase